MDKKFIKNISEYFNISEAETENAMKDFSEGISSFLDDPHSLVKAVCKVLNNFHKDIKTSNAKYGSDRKNYILNRINFLDLFLNGEPTSNQIALDILEKKKEQIIEQHDYWEKELTRLPDTNKRIRELDVEFKKREIIRMFKHVRSNLLKLVGHNLYTLGKVNKEELNEAKYIFQNIKEELESYTITEIYEVIISISQEIKNKTTSKDTIFIDKLLDFNNNQSQNKKDQNANDHAISCKVEYNANYFNEISYHFFAYLIVNYVNEEEIYEKARGVKQKLSYVWHFMKDCDRSEDYTFKMTKNKFKEIIKCNYGIELKNMDRKISFYKHLSSLNQHLLDYKEEIALKNTQNT